MAKNNFRGMPGGMNQAAMMRQAQKMQQDLLRMQEEQENKTYTASAGGGDTNFSRTSSLDTLAMILWGITILPFS